MRLFTAVAAVLAVATVVGLVVLWPGDVETPLAEGFAVDTQRAEVERGGGKALPELHGADVPDRDRPRSRAVPTPARTPSSS